MAGRFSEKRPAVLLSGAHSGKLDRKSTRLNSSHDQISYDVFCLKKKRVHIEDDAIQAATQDGRIQHCTPTGDEAILVKSSNAMTNRLLIRADLLRDVTKRLPELRVQRAQSPSLEQFPQQMDIKSVQAPPRGSVRDWPTKFLSEAGQQVEPSRQARN